MDILSPIEEVTRSISAELAGFSIVIPCIRVLTRTLEKNASVNVDIQVLPESSAPKRLCPLQSPVLLDVFTEIIADSSEETPESGATSEVAKYLSDPVID